MMRWLMSFGAKRLIQQMDILEPLLATKIKEGQKRINEIPPEQFAKELIDEIQIKLCMHLKLNPEEILKP